MGAIEDLGLDYQPMVRAVPDAPPKERPVSEHVVDELIDEERKLWTDEEERYRNVTDLAPGIEQMLMPSVQLPHEANKIARRVAEFILDHGMDVSDDQALRNAIVKLSHRAEPLELGNLHPALKAYAYVQAVKNGGATI